MKPNTPQVEIIDGVPQGRPFPIFMSGSLINNGNEEIWAYVHLFNPISFPSRQHFKRTFLSAIGIISTELIIRAIAANFFRKTKKEIGIFVHDPIPMEHIIELVPGSDLYNFQKEVVEDFMIKLDDMGDEVVSIAGILAELHYARLSLVAQDFMVSVPLRDSMGYIMKDERGKVMKKRVPKHLNAPVSKLEYAAEHIFELVMGERENVLVFSANFNTPIVWLMEKLRGQGIKCDAITGDSRISKVDAGDLEVQFQQNELQVLFLNMKSGAEGMNLHKDVRWPGGSSNVVMLDRWWNPAIENQAIERAWRLGCLEPVEVHRYSVDNSVDQIMEGIVNDKIAAAEGVTEHAGLRAKEWRD
jgi:SNF2 family DNA or RNA helicase